MATVPPPGQAPYGQPPQQPYPNQPGQNPYGQHPYGQGAPGQAPYGQNPYGQGTPGQNPYGQAPQGQNPFGQGPQPYPQQAQQGGGGCTICGGYPAVPATVRGHQGFLVMMKFLKRRGTFCRSCGIAIHREMTTNTLWQGWWGFASFLITPVTVLLNLAPRSAFNKLPTPTGGVRPPLDPGKPIFGRPGAFGVLVPLIAVAVIATAIITDNSASTASVGDCVSKSGTNFDPTIKVVDCSSTSAAYKVAEKHSGKHNGDACGDTYAEYDETGGGDNFALCLTPLH